MKNHLFYFKNLQVQEVAWIEWQNDTTGLIIYNDGRYLTKTLCNILKFAEGYH